MNKRKSLILLIIFALIILGIIFSNNTAVKLGNVLVLEDIMISSDTRIIIYDEGEYIGSQMLSKGLFGWKSAGLSAPVKKAKANEPFRPDVQGIRTGDFGYYFGNVNPDFVKSVMIETEEYNFEYKVNSNYWYVISREKATSENLSFIMNDGTKVYYPFYEKYMRIMDNDINN